MRSETDFEPAASLADCPTLSIVVGEIPVRGVKACTAAAAKDGAASAENVGRKARARNWITQGQRA